MTNDKKIALGIFLASGIATLYLMNKTNEVADSINSTSPSYKFIAGSTLIASAGYLVLKK